MDLYLTVLIRIILWLLRILLLLKNWAHLSSKPPSQPVCHVSHPQLSQHENIKRLPLLWRFYLDQNSFSPCPVLFILGPQPCFSLHLCSRGFWLSVTNETSLPSLILDDFPLPGTLFLVRCIIEEPERHSGRLKSCFKDHGIEISQLSSPGFHQSPFFSPCPWRCVSGVPACASKTSNDGPVETDKFSSAF